jgi:hypothetical protein
VLFYETYLLANATVVDDAIRFVSLKSRDKENQKSSLDISNEDDNESEGLGDATKDMKIVPVNFDKEHKAMLGHCKMILEHEPRKIAINPDKFDKLITALRTAVDNDGTLDKELTSYNDIFDAFRLALKFYHFEESHLHKVWNTF